jgi:hypothetical protein
VANLASSGFFLLSVLKKFCKSFSGKHQVESWLLISQHKRLFKGAPNILKWGKLEVEIE